MVEPAVVLRPSRAFRWAALVLMAAGLIVWALYVGMAALDHAWWRLLISAMILVNLAGRPLPILVGRTTVRPEEVVAVRPPGKTVVIPQAQVARIEVRRGWLLEWVVLHRRKGSALQLFGPMRLWFRRDPSFDRSLTELSSLAGAGTVTRSKFSLRFMIAGPMLTATAVMLVLLDAPWQSDAWPGRSHAKSLPDTCPALADIARRSVPGARVDERGQGIGQTSGRRSCRWTETSGGEGRNHDGVGELTVEYELFHRIGWSSDADEARDQFERDSRPIHDQGAVPVSGIGDEARLLTSASAERDFATVAVIARRWNVVVNVGYTLDGPHQQAQAARTASDAVRAALAAVRFH
ncbi:hypothetical protein GCM10023196_031390 [Actinoallomurus vinaceus]|uniref:Uncharacterized protein n=1 Tax=Actinoallomurus vinaceus TaxID=1080074 RepID=A0ABP8U9K0_9ACTN